MKKKLIEFEVMPPPQKKDNQKILLAQAEGRAPLRGSQPEAHVVREIFLGGERGSNLKLDLLMTLRPGRHSQWSGSVLWPAIRSAIQQVSDGVKKKNGNGLTQSTDKVLLHFDVLCRNTFFRPYLPITKSEFKLFS